MMVRTLAVYVFATVFGISLLLFTLRKRRGNRYKTVTGGCRNRVLFFPDYSASGESYHILSEALNSAHKCVDLCVYCLASRKLVDILISIHRRGNTVRVITDQEQESISGGQVMRLRQSGIQVRTNNSSYLMHHKFCLIDKTHLINGSLNWTAQGVECNEENVIITDDPALVSPFEEQFDKLWNKYDPLSKVLPMD